MNKMRLKTIFVLYLLPFISIIGQEYNISIKEKNIFSPEAASSQIMFQNSSGFTLGSIIDESDSRGLKFGSLYLSQAQSSVSGIMDNKLWINYRGDLMFGDSPLGGWWTWSGSVLTFPTGYMVIGNSLTQAANTNVLTVLGRATFNSIKISDGNEGDGKILVSDADGVGSWQDFSSGGSIDQLFDGKTTLSSLYLGYNAGENDDPQSSSDNVGVGFNSLTNADSDVLRNTAVGYYSMSAFSLGNDNTAIGFEALKGGDSGPPAGNSQNTAIGSGALRNNSSGSGNVAIGFEAGKNSTGDDKLYIHNSDAGTSSLIYGDFQFADLTINGSLEVTQGITGTVSPPSDIRYKENIRPINNALNLINKLKGVRYDWKIEEFPDKNFPNKLQIGLIAQEVEKVLPEIVNTRRDGYKGIEYSKITAVLINAIQEQQKMIEGLRDEIKEMKSSKRFTYSSN